MKFGDLSRSHRKTWFIGEHQFIGIYTFNCRDLRQPRLISHAAPAMPQKYRVSGKTRTVKTPSARGSLFPLFSCNGQPVIALVSAETACRLIARKSSAWPNSRPMCGFFTDLPETAGQPQRRVVIVVKIRMVDGRDYEIQPRRRRRRQRWWRILYRREGEKRKDKKSRRARIRKEVHRPEEMGIFASSGLLLARHWENVVR